VEIGFLEYSCVLQAESHNPTIINPDWLKMHGIVPDSWELAQQPVIMPALAQIQFDSGVKFFLQEQKLVVSVVGDDPALREQIASSVTQYAETLPHTPYLGIGHNAKAGLEVPEAHKAMLDLVGGSLNLDEPVASTSVKAFYADVNGAVRSVTLEAGQASRQRPGEDEPTVVNIVMADVNYHRSCNSLEEITAAASCVESDMDNFAAYLMLLGGKLGL
jgi:hypothetical protein